MPGKSDNTRREELRAQLAEVREKQAEIKKGKQAVYEQLDALNESIRKKVGYGMCDMSWAVRYILQ